MITTTAVTYRVGHRALVDDCTVDFASGGVTVVLGPNGAGKSTLLRLLAGDLSATAGGIALAGRPLSEWPLAAIARFRAVVTQFNQIAFPFTVAEVVALGRLPHRAQTTAAADAAAVSNALHCMGVAELAARSYPTLSGGEQQRVAIARALAQLDVRNIAAGQTRYFLLDEPTASLDLAHQHTLMRQLQEIARAGCAVIAVLHDINLALTYADKVVVMDNGRIVAAGITAETLTVECIERVFRVATRRVTTGPGCETLIFGGAVCAPPRLS